MSTDVEAPPAHDPAGSELPPSERPVAPAGGLAIAALVLGTMGAVLGATLVWFFLALPLGLAAVVCGAVERRRTRRRTGGPAGGIVTAGMVLGGVSILLSLAGLAVIPRIEGAAQRLIGITQDDVRTDLEELEASFGATVDRLDETLTNNVETSTDSLERDFEGLERSSAEELAQLEDRVTAIIESVERTTGEDLSSIEAALSEDLASLEAAVDSDVRAVTSRVDEFERQLASVRSSVDRALAEAP